MARNGGSKPQKVKVLCTYIFRQQSQAMERNKYRIFKENFFHFLSFLRCVDWPSRKLSTISLRGQETCRNTIKKIVVWLLEGRSEMVERLKKFSFNGH